MFPFLLKKQSEKLLNYTAATRQRKKVINAPSVAGCREALEAANHSYSVYLLATRKTLGLFKSFIPGTKEFGLRVKCAIDISTAFTLLKKVDKNIQQLEKAKLPPVIAATKAPVLSKSDDGVQRLPKVHKSPIRQSKSADNTPAHSTTVNIIITPRPTFH